MNKAAQIGARIRGLRQSRDANQAVVAEAVGMARASLSMIETGKDTPGLHLAVALADYFGVSLDYLVRGAAAPGPGQPGDTPQNAEEVALLHAWRALERPQQETIARLMQHLAATGDGAEPSLFTLLHRRILSATES